MSPEVYRILHHLGLLLVFTGLGGLAVVATGPGSEEEKKSRRRQWTIGHGVGMVLLFLGGFGLLPTAGVSHAGAWPIWVFGKLGVWLVLGASVALVKRVTAYGQLAYIVIPVVGLIAVYLVTFRPA